MTSLTDAAAATPTVAATMIGPIIPALPAAETPALAATAIMASTLIYCTFLPAATALPLSNKRIISANNQLNCVHIVVFHICLALIFFLLISV